VAREEDLWPQKQFTLTLVITTPQFLQKHPRTVERFLAAHCAWTDRLRQNPAGYARQLDQALHDLTGKTLPAGVMEAALQHVRFTNEPLEDTLQTFARWSYELEFARQPVQLDALVDTTILRKVQSESGPVGATRPSRPGQVTTDATANQPE
jgi:NitT/TauT family transport system substrate-binding protein